MHRISIGQSGRFTLDVKFTQGQKQSIESKFRSESEQFASIPIRAFF
jgi:hypothetical protein